MTGQELAARLGQFGDIDVNPEQVVGWIDQCQKEIATEAGKVIRVAIPVVTSGVEIALPTDYAAMITILVNNVGYRKMSRIIIREDNFIVFPENLTSVSIIYRKIPVDYSNLSMELEIHPLLQPLVLYYLIAMYYDKEGEGDREESGLASKYFNKFEYLKQNTLAKLRNNDNDGPVDTQDVMPKRAKGRTGSNVREDEDGYV